jgi:hypothetical protein
MVEDSFKGREVAMNVGDDSEAHGQRQRRSDLRGWRGRTVEAARDRAANMREF